MIAPSQSLSHAPIGVFDSGLGGLTVVRRLQEMLPHERLLYVADQAHVPYGGRDLEEVKGFACGISAALIAAGCKAIVMACNISSATALEEVQRWFPEVPVLGVIRPGAQAAAKRTRNGRVGVLATYGTVMSGAYTAALQGIEPALAVTEVACPAFVPLVESDQLDTPEAWSASEEYMAPLHGAGVDTIILGCTHYPFLMPSLCRFSEGLHFIDPAEQTAYDLADCLIARHLLATASTPRHLLTTTGDAGEFGAQVIRFLPDAGDCAEIGAARWHEGVLSLPLSSPQ